MGCILWGGSGLNVGIHPISSLMVLQTWQPVLAILGQYGAGLTGHLRSIKKEARWPATKQWMSCYYGHGSAAITLPCCATNSILRI